MSQGLIVYIMGGTFASVLGLIVGLVGIYLLRKKPSKDASKD